MIGRIILIAVAVVALGAVIAWWTGQLPFAETSEVHADNPAAEGTSKDQEEPAQPVEIGKPLYVLAAGVVAPSAPAKKFALGADPIVMGDSVLNVEKQDVPCQRDGQILFIGTSVSAEEWAKLPKDLQIEKMVRGQLQKYRKLKPGDEVAADQLLAIVDDRVANAEVNNKKAKVEAAIADKRAADAVAVEGAAQYATALKLGSRNSQAAPQEEVNLKKATMIKYQEEAKGKGTAIEQARMELNQAEVVLGQHEIRSAIPGVIKTIHKNFGESVKSSPSYETVFQILNMKKLRAEGFLEEQHLPFLKTGMKVVIERSAPQRPLLTLVGHLQEVTGVAVNRDAKLIVSSSSDGTVRVWDRAEGKGLRKLDHPTEVKAVACTPAGAKANLCLSGSRDGLGRLWDLDSDSTKPLRALAAKHRGPINCVAFSPDGAVCATGSDDREIWLWDTATGDLKYRLLGHSGPVTSIQFTPNSQLVSAARDATLRLWKLGTEAGRLEKRISGRSTDVPRLGVSPDGKYALFDPQQGKTLRILSLPEELTEGVLKNPSGAGQFNTLAQFSPDGQMILTAGGNEGRLQLWRSPLSTGRAYVLRQLESEEHAQPTCGAFAPDGLFIVAGTKDKNVLVWETPKKKEIEQLRTATVVFIDPGIDTSSHQTRIWADLDDAEGFSPGMTVTMVRYPGDK